MYSKLAIITQQPVLPYSVKKELKSCYLLQHKVFENAYDFMSSSDFSTYSFVIIDEQGAFQNSTSNKKKNLKNYIKENMWVFSMPKLKNNLRHTLYDLKEHLVQNSLAF